MSFGAGPTGFQAVKALVDSQADLRAVADKDWAAAAGLIVKKLLNAAGQSADSLNALKTAVGDEIFEAQMKSLSHHQARLLAKRLDKSVADLEVSTARAAIAHIRLRLAVPEPPGPQAVIGPESVSPEPSTGDLETVTDVPAEEAAPSAPNPYFGRKSFRVD
jgi:hypothetical protein